MLKKFILIIFIFVSSCGYEAMYSKKNEIIYDFYINEIAVKGDSTINFAVKQKLKAFTDKKKDRFFTLEIISSSDRNIIAKDTKGNATDFENVIKVNVKVLIEDKIKDEFQFEESFKYINSTDKPELGRYEREIKINLTEIIVRKLIIKLSKI